MAPVSLHLYRAATAVAEPLLPLLLKSRLKRGKEIAERLNERLGHPNRPRPAGPLVWMHGASIGETISLLPLVAPLQARGLAVMLTSGTVTSAEIAQKRLSPGAFHQFVPLDGPRAARRFIEYWRPDLVLIAESEIWPNLIREAARSGATLAIVNGRMSARSMRTWGRAPAGIRDILARFSVVLGQSEGDAERYRALGAAGAVCVGNMKFDVAAPAADPAALADLKARIGTRPVFIAASTHPGEEEIILAAHRAAAQRLPGLLTVIAPRHPERGEPLMALARTAGLAAARRSAGGAIAPETALYVADTIGELGLIYRLGGIAFLGGSFIPHGGQNPIEPAKLGLGVLHGPHVFNFTDVFAAFDGAGGSLPVADPDALGPLVADLLTDPARLAAMQTAARTSADALGGALERTLAALDPHITRITGRAR